MAQIDFPYKRLQGNDLIPMQMLGTFPMKGNQLRKSVMGAMRIGLRGFDCARDYLNEIDLGVAINEACIKNNLTRANLFVTTKIGNQQQKNYVTHINFLQDIDTSLFNLKMEYVDLLLLHWPLPDYYIKTWKLLEELPYEKVHNIGVCNFRKRHLVKLINNCGKKPALNQIEIHPLYVDWDTITFCQENGIAIQAYCPLGLMDSRLTQSDILNKLSFQYNKSIAQIVLRWHFQHGFLTIPKSSDPNRIKENGMIFDFELAKYEMGLIDGMNLCEKKYIESFYCPGY